MLLSIEMRSEQCQVIYAHTSGVKLIPDIRKYPRLNRNTI